MMRWLCHICGTCFSTQRPGWHKPGACLARDFTIFSQAMQGLMQDSKATASCSCSFESRAADYCKGFVHRSRISPFWCKRQAQKLKEVGPTCMLEFYGPTYSSFCGFSAFLSVAHIASGLSGETIPVLTDERWRASPPEQAGSRESKFPPFRLPFCSFWQIFNLIRASFIHLSGSLTCRCPSPAAPPPLRHPFKFMRGTVV
ncbi:hypothetical protein BDW62DRAFT_148870 [Aspergillus aurantiobrunneus]